MLLCVSVLHSFLGLDSIRCMDDCILQIHISVDGLFLNITVNFGLKGPLCVGLLHTVKTMCYAADLLRSGV